MFFFSYTILLCFICANKRDQWVQPHIQNQFPATVSGSFFSSIPHPAKAVSPKTATLTPSHFDVSDDPIFLFIKLIGRDSIKSNPNGLLRNHQKVFNALQLPQLQSLRRTTYIDRKSKDFQSNAINSIAVIKMAAFPEP